VWHQAAPAVADQLEATCGAAHNPVQQCRLQHVATQRNNVLQLTVSIGWGASGGVAAGRPLSGCATASFAIGTRERGASGQPCGDQLERRKLIPLLVKARRWACRRPRWQHLTTAHRYRDVLEARQCGTGSGRDIATVRGGGGQMWQGCAPALMPMWHGREALCIRPPYPWWGGGRQVGVRADRWGVGGLERIALEASVTWQE
jgi:hypothetical protein